MCLCYSVARIAGRGLPSTPSLLIADQSVSHRTNIIQNTFDITSIGFHPAQIGRKHCCWICGIGQDPNALTTAYSKAS